MPPRGIFRGRLPARAACDRTKEDEPFDQIGAPTREQARGDRAPRMSHDRHARHRMPTPDEFGRVLQLLARVFRAPESRMKLCGFAHLSITVGAAESQEVEPPDMKACVDELVAPRTAVEAVCDGQCRWKRRAV